MTKYLEWRENAENDKRRWELVKKHKKTAQNAKKTKRKSEIKRLYSRKEKRDAILNL
jgi:hypothetical protein